MAKREATGNYTVSEDGVSENTLVDKGSMDALFADTTAELMSAYVNEGLVYSGVYLTQVRAVYKKQNDDDAEFDAGRLVFNLAVTYLNKNNPAEKLGDGFIKTSPQARYTATGRLDNACKRYAELAKALKLRGLDYEEVYETAKQTMFFTKVRETYQVPEDDLHDSHSDSRCTNGTAWVALKPEEVEAREYYIDLGLEPKTMVDRITVAKVN